MTQHIARLQVEGGFLDGLDLEFVPGLNVLIGPRGSGKTSVIELIRHCLDVRAVTDETDDRAREHAQSVLGPDGRITVTIMDGAREVTVSRGADDDRPRRTAQFSAPRIFSQAEIERVGLEASGRLRILDSVIDPAAGGGSDAETIRSTIASLTVQIRELYSSVETTHEYMSSFGPVADELKDATKEQQAVLRTVKESEKRQAQLAELSKNAATASIQVRQLESARAEVARWRNEVLKALARPSHIAEWQKEAGPKDLLATVRAKLLRVTELMGGGVDLLSEVLEQIAVAQADSQANALVIEEKARDLRRQLEQIQAGAGSAAQRVALLQDRVSQLSAMEATLKDLANRIDILSKRRGALLSDLEASRNRQFLAREKAAKALSKALSPAIEIIVEQGGDAPGYIGALQAALRGTGLHYNTLGPLLANAMSPRELVEAAERSDAPLIARLSGIPEERASKVILALVRSGGEQVITAPIHDRVTMRLLDGNDYKATTELSTGQRCTVVLSVLLAAEGRGLVIDQPEDHLDNAFIVSTLIEGIAKRKGESQLILTTHNANIPVLADAERVVLLGSDGQRGFVRTAGAVDAPPIVEAITSVMEGGYVAFERRATFYRDNMRRQSR